METNEKDPELWRMAKKRVKFKRHLVAYILVNALLWVLWLLTDDGRSSIPWPVFSTVGWGIGLAFDYVGSYGVGSGNAVEKEYERMKSKNR